MNTISINALISLLVVTLLCTAPITATAGDEPNILIMNIDGDKDTISRNNRVSKRLLASLVNQISDAGYNIYDETAVTLDNFAQARARRSEAELIKIAKLAEDPPIDIVIFYSTYAGANALNFTTEVKVRITGRILNVRNGQRLGNFELISPREWTVEPECSRECILEEIGDFGTILADDLGAILVEKLAPIVNGPSSTQPVNSSDNALLTGYTMFFRNFTEDEVAELEEFMLDFSGYARHRPLYIARTSAKFRYETSLNSAALNRNMKNMLEALGLNARIQFSGTRFTIQKITLRGENQGRSRVNKDW